MKEESVYIKEASKWNCFMQC